MLNNVKFPPNKAIDKLRAAHPEQNHFSNMKRLRAISPQVDSASIEAPLRHSAAHPDNVRSSDKTPNRLSTNPPNSGTTKCLSGASEINDAQCSEILPDRAPNNRSSVANFARALENPKMPHEDQLWSSAQMDLGKNKCSEVPPDNVSNRLNAAPPESDQLKSHEKLARPQVNPTLPHEAQRRFFSGQNCQEPW